MLKLVAAQYKSGLAIVYDGKFVLYKPPYEQEKFCVLSPEAITNAISKQGFQPEDIDFTSFDELLKFIRGKLLKGEWEKK
jgi:hypothetical protein